MLRQGRGLLLGCALAVACNAGLAEEKPAAAGSAPTADAACAKAPAKPLEIKLLDNEPITFSAAGDSASVPLPLVPGEGVDASQLTPHRLQVRRDALADEALARQFELAPEIVGKASQAGQVSNPVPVLTVKVSSIAKLLPARYVLTIAWTHRCGWPVAPLVVKLDRPAATVLPPGKVTLDLFMPIGMGLGNATAGPQSLQIQPADNNALSALRGAELFEEGFRGSKGVATGGTLGPMKPASAAAGEPLVLAFRPQGFEVGTATGKAQLRSADLKAPLAIEFELRSRLLSWWIVVVVAGGILFGMWLRVTLQSRIEHERVRTERLQAFAELQRRCQDVADALFVSATRPALQAFHDALLRGSKEEIVSCGDKAKAAIDKASAELEATLAEAKRQLAALRAIPAGHGVLPAPLQAAVDALAAPCDAAAASVNAHDASTAKRELDSARQAFEAALDREWPGVEHALAEQDRALGRLAGLLDPQQAGARKLGEDLRFADKDYADLAQQLAMPELSDAAALLAALARWRQLGRRRPQGLRDWATWLREDRARLDALAARRIASRAELTAERQTLHDAVHALAGALEAASTQADPFAAVADLAPRAQLAREAAAALVSAVAKTHSALTDEQRQAMVDALDDGRSFAAVQALPLPPASTVMSAGGAARGAPKAAEAGGLPELAQRETKARTDRLAASPVFDSAALQAAAARSARELARAQWLQTAIVAAVTGAAAYVFFQERFIGTPTELLGLFFWGFTADVSVDGLMKLAGGLSAKTKS